MPDCDGEYGSHDWRVADGGYACARCGLVDLTGTAIVRRLAANLTDGD